MRARLFRSMLYAVVLPTVVLLSIPATVQAQIENPANGHYYAMVASEGASWEWEDARDDASQMTYMGMPGHLVTIGSQDEQDFLYNNFSQDFQERIWLGGSDEGSEGNWWWVTGEPWVYENWAGGQGGPDENCLILYDTSFEWHDDGCTDGNRFLIVEFEPEGVPALPISALLGLGALLLLGTFLWLRC